MNESLHPNLGLEDLRWLHQLARQLVQDPDDADDAVQDTVLAALTRSPQDVRSPRGWLARVLLNVVRQGHRGTRRRVAREREGGVQDHARSTVEVVEELAWHRTLVDQVNALEEPYRSTIVLRFLRGQSPREIACEQRIPVKTVHTRIERGLAHLRRALDRESGGDRNAWMPAITALAAPIGSGGEAGIYVLGAMAMGTTMKVSAAVLVGAVCVYLMTRTPQQPPTTQLPTIQPPTTQPTDSPPTANVVSPSIDEDLDGTGTSARSEDAPPEATRRDLVSAEPPVDEPAIGGTNTLRVVLEGITEDDARIATITLTGTDEDTAWPSEVEDSWSCQGLTSEFDLDPLLEKVEQHTNLRVDELMIEVDHPAYFLETTRVSLSNGVRAEAGQTLHEARVRMVLPVYWPELKLAVRDANTRKHLENVELSTVSTLFMGTPRVPGRGSHFTSLGGGLNSPIVLLGSREADDAEQRVAGLALQKVPGAAPTLFELGPQGRARPGQGIIVYARAPGYAWGLTSVDVSSKGERELLLVPAAELSVRLTNVRLESYAELETTATLCVYRYRDDGGVSFVRFERLDELPKPPGLRLESLDPGRYLVTVELRGGVWSEQPALAHEELTLAGGETHDLVLALTDPPEPPKRATLGGTIAFPAFDRQKNVRLQFYFDANRRFRNPNVELSLADMQSIGGTIPTWSFRVEDQPVGLYRVQLLPFLKNMMIELPVDGREDIDLVVPELAEVLVETVDARSGERIPIEEFFYRNEDTVPGQVDNDWAQADTEEPGRFRFFALPGKASIWPLIPTGLDYGRRWEDLELVPGLQSMRFELEPVYAMHFEFREGGVALPVGSYGVSVNRDIRPVDHDGTVTHNGLQTDMRVEVSAPGVYEISFEGIDTDRYASIPSRRVFVRAGETTRVIVELRRK